MRSPPLYRRKASLFFQSVSKFSRAWLCPIFSCLFLHQSWRIFFSFISSSELADFFLDYQSWRIFFSLSTVSATSVPIHFYGCVLSTYISRYRNIFFFNLLNIWTRRRCGTATGSIGKKRTSLTNLTCQH
jgi:hypothetical protein